MIHFFVQTFFGTKSVYILAYSKEQFVEQLQYLLDGTKGFYASVNITGRFTTYPDKFILQPKWSLAFIRGLETSFSYIRGTITDSGLDETKVAISVRPNIFFFLMFLTSSIIGFKNLYNLLAGGWDEDLFVGFLFFIVFINPAIIFISRNVTKVIRERFKKYFSVFGDK